MAVVNVKSAQITNADASPAVYNNTLVQHGRVKSSVAFADFAASDATSIARVLRVPSSARVTRLEYAADDLGTGGTIDIGLYRTTADGGAVVDDDFFASALDTDSAAVARTDITYESAVVGIEKAGMALWEQLGNSADTFVDYDIVVLRNTAAGTGTVTLWLEYVEN